MKDLEKVKHYIEEDFKDLFTDKSLTEFLVGESKRIRSKTAILYARANGCEITENVYNILAAGEIVHNASLLHDDVLDEADLRRGKTVLAVKYSPKISILCGDYLLSFAIEKLLKINKPKILEIFKNCTKKMSEAEIKQYFLRGKCPSETEYIEICKGKTSSLFSAMFESLAIELNLDTEKAKKFGNIFGLYFQIKNDMEEHSATIDKKNGIKTAVDILGIEKTEILLDNLKEEMKEFLIELPHTKPRRALEDLFSK